MSFLSLRAFWVSLVLVQKNPLFAFFGERKQGFWWFFKKYLNRPVWEDTNMLMEISSQVFFPSGVS